MNLDERRTSPQFLPPDQEAWIATWHDSELSITPTKDGFKVSLWSWDGKCLSTAVLHPDGISYPLTQRQSVGHTPSDYTP